MRFSSSHSQLSQLSSCNALMIPAKAGAESAREKAAECFSFGGCHRLVLDTLAFKPKLSLPRNCLSNLQLHRTTTC